MSLVAVVMEAVRYCAQPQHLRRTIPIALAAGTLYYLINQSGVLLSGDIPPTSCCAAR